MDLSTTMWAKFEALREIPISALTNHNCHHCQKIVLETQKAYWIQILPYDVKEAIKATEDGCMLYGWLLNQIKKSGKSPDLLGGDRFFFSLQYKDVAFDGRAMWDVHLISILIGTEAYRWPCATFHIYADASDPASGCVTTRPWETDVTSESSFAAVRKWIHCCLSQHKQCTNEDTQISYSVPKRLLDVGSTGDVIYLQETINKRSTFDRYLALSYCWGGDQFCKTTKGTLWQHIRGISIQSLSLSLKHAVQVTRRLGFRFLWVDCLCIQQDDPVEIAEEVMRMPMIYENAFLVISAASAAASTDGFLQPRYMTYITGPFKLRYRCPNGTIGSVNLIQVERYSPKNEIINSRGWTFQESSVATRLLTYGKEGLRWSCQEAQFSNGGPWGLSYDIPSRTKWHDLRYKIYTARRASTLPTIHTEDFLGEWRAIVEEFSSRSLKLRRDKLPAISGIAEKYQEFFSYSKFNEGKFQYCAGLWRQDLCRQLLWVTKVGKNEEMIHDQTHAPEQSTAESAPSWSWASVDETVLFPDWEFIPTEIHTGNGPSLRGRWMKEDQAEVVQYEQDPISAKAPFGELRSAKLTIRGRVIVDISNYEEFELVPDKLKYAITLDFETNKASGTVILLQLIRSEIMKGNHQLRPRGLVLQQIRDSGLYRRIGIFRTKLARGLGGDRTAPFDSAVLQYVTIV